MGDLGAGRHNAAQRAYFERRPKPRMLPSGSPYLRRQADALCAFARLTAGERVLDVGCGMGRHTLLLAESGIAVEGLDLSSVLLERLRAFAAGRFEIPVHAGDVAEPPDELLGRFDAVVGTFALHHVHDLRGAFAGASRLLRPGGRVAFLEPNPANPLYYAQLAFTPGMSWRGDGGIVRMRPRLVFGAMDEAGLVDLRLRRFGFFPPFAANTRGGGALERRLERIRVLRPVLPFQLFGGVRS